jgi:hypothetical protein
VLAAPFAFALLASTPARADTSDTDRTVAQSLFDQARRSMDEGRYDEACPKLAESQRLDPGGGTLLNLAICHAAQGRTATAWAELNEALSVAKRDGRADRETTAREHLASLEGKLSTLTISVPPEARVPGLELRLDGATLGSAAWETPTPVDPGRHEVSVTARGRRPWKQDVRVRPDGDRRTIRIPVLEALPDAAAPAKPVREGASTSRTAAYVVAGIGLAALAVGGFFGIRAVMKKNESDSHCQAGCNQTGVDAWSDAKTSAAVFDVGFAVGLVSVGVASYLFITSTPASPADPPPSPPRSALDGGPAGLGVRWAKTF